MPKPPVPDPNAPRPAPDTRPRAEPALSDPAGSHALDAMLEQIANQPRDVKPKWTAESAGRENAAYEGRAVPLPAHPTPPMEAPVLVRPSVVGPRTTVLVDRVVRRRLIIQIFVAAAAAVAVLTVGTIILRWRSDASPPPSASRPTLAPTTEPPASVSPPTISVATTPSGTTAGTESAPPQPAVSIQPPASAPAARPPRPQAPSSSATSPAGHSNLYDPSRQ